jgi:hypothetical protein
MSKGLNHAADGDGLIYLYKNGRMKVVSNVFTLKVYCKAPVESVVEK